ncbi:MAG TPA: sugar phosphate isomerase/epimerase [Armatimonadota bacterium]|nr:sugar phosphate isomerase/epimerase [Armatimonadota bacterium]
MITSGVAAQLYTLREFTRTPADIAATITRLKAMGYNGVQLSALGPIDPHELAAILRGEGMAAAATHVGWDRLRTDLPALIAEHTLWGCQHVAIGGLPGEYRTAEGYVRFAQEATEVARALRAEGLTFSYHNHSFELERFGGPTALELIYQNSGPDLLAEIDTYWIQHGGADPADWCARMQDRMVIVHFKDMAVVEGAPVMAEVGEGNLNWPRILQACRATGVQWYAVEQDVCRRDPFESLAISLRHLRAWGIEDR